jgi:hypothetical protein
MFSGSRHFVIMAWQVISWPRRHQAGTYGASPSRLPAWKARVDHEAVNYALTD